MRRIDNGADWHDEYRRDIQIAREEIALNFPIAPENMIADVYCLPAHNHQTFLCRVICESGFMKLIYAKAVQNSIWFSEPIYMYRFEEARSFADHPIRHGRIVCGKKIIRKTAVDHLITMISAIADEQPDDLVSPVIDSEFTVVTMFENGEQTREIAYTDAEKLVFRGDAENPYYANYMRDLHLIIERIIGVGTR